MDDGIEEELVLRVVSEGRRLRLRRAALIAAVCVGLAGAATVPVLVATQQPDRPAAVAGRTPAPPVRPAGMDALRLYDDQAQIYAAALASRGQGHQTVYVRTRICSTVARRPAAQHCYAGVIPDPVQRRVSALLGGRVRFVAGPDIPFGASGRNLVVFGAIGMRGDRATLPIEVLCGSLCGEGRTLTLARSGDGWAVTGSSGPDWVS
jgi:hypothetical protein